MDYLPHDPAILVSSVNMLLRDEEYDTLEELCFAFNREPEEIKDYLLKNGYVWSESQEQFRPIGYDEQDRTIRRATRADVDTIMTIFEAARKIMADSGNPNQWRNGYPSEAAVWSDMEKDSAYVIVDEQRIAAYFAFLPSPEPTYAKIYEGEWLDHQRPYHVIHRIASLPDVHDIFSSIMDFCFAHESNIRIDTHKDNRIMQHNIEKHGFTYCGIIHLASGDERLAYQRIIERIEKEQ